MSIFHSFTLGIVEGITEFLPISSTAHLILASHLLRIPQTDFQKFFEVFIQSGAILAVFFLYTKYLLKNKQVVKFMILSFLPTAVIGFLLYKIIKNVFFESNLLISSALVIVGIIFLVIELLINKKKIVLQKTISNLTIGNTLLIGLAQSLAVIPGVSRAGIVMVFMMVMGFKREESAKYSFLLAVPTILAASSYDLYKMKDNLLGYQDQFLILAVGFITSFIIAYFVINWFVNFLQKNTLTIFGFYRIFISFLFFI